MPSLYAPGGRDGTPSPCICLGRHLTLNPLNYLADLGFQGKPVLSFELGIPLAVINLHLFLIFGGMAQSFIEKLDLFKTF